MPLLLLGSGRAAFARLAPVAWESSLIYRQILEPRADHKGVMAAQDVAERAAQALAELCLGRHPRV